MKHAKKMRILKKINRIEMLSYMNTFGEYTLFMTYVIKNLRVAKILSNCRQTFRIYVKYSLYIEW